MHILKRRKKDKTIVAIFAHPDDEAFGPAGTLAQLARDNDVYILCATRGEAEGNHDLGRTRSEELAKSAKVLGVKKVFLLGFRDGTLSNALYHKLAEKIENHLKSLRPHTLITFENRGVSGHIDHIVVSMVTTYVFYRVPSVRTLLYYCISQEARSEIDDYFIYFPEGHKKSEIDKVVNIEDVWPKKVEAMLAHKTQIQDAKRILANLEKLPKEECFLVLKKP